jgi:murein DD-endopeptidase MepM/ murein hydrolase activator NlpD
MSYIIPFKRRPVVIGQGFHGPSHRDWKADKEDFSYSIDFLLPKNTEILASRAGTVSRVETTGKKNYKGKDPEKGEIAYRRWMNEIEIRHSDGTYASYSHLAYKGSFVAVGDLVKQSQLIGLSGNTGWSSAPHLDFSVFKRNTANRKIKTLRIKFDNFNGTLENNQIPHRLV